MALAEKREERAVSSGQRKFWLACCLFLLDVAVRRIAPDFGRMRRAIANQWRQIRGQEPVRVSEYMDKLRSRKAEVGEELDRSRSRGSAVPGLPPEGSFSSTVIAEPLLSGQEPAERGKAPRDPASPQPKGLAPEAEKPREESYANRLLKAKQRVWEEREKDNPKPGS